MEFSIERDVFFECLANITQVIPTRSPNKVLTNVLLEVMEASEGNEGELLLKGTNFEQTMIARATIKTVKAGSCGTPAKKLYELLRELPNKLLIVKSNTQLRIAVEGTDNLYSLPLVKAEEFPEIPTKIDAEFSFKENAERFLQMHSKTSFVSGQDISMITYTGVLWQIKPDEVRMVATDGHRLAFFGDKHPTEVKEEHDLLIPSQSSELLARLLAKSNSDTFRVDGSRANLLFQVDNYSLITRLIVEKFPNYEVVIPRDNDKRLVINRDDLIAALRRAEIFCSPLSHLVVLEMDKDITKIVTADAQTGSNSSENLSAQYTGERLRMGISAKDLIEITRHIDGENVAFDLKEALTALTVEPEKQKEEENQFYLVMPLRIPEE